MLSKRNKDRSTVFAEPKLSTRYTNLRQTQINLILCLQLSRKELSIISSTRLLNKLLDTLEFLTEISSMLKHRGKIRVLIKGMERDFAYKFRFNNNLNLGDPIAYKESIQLNS